MNAAFVGDPDDVRSWPVLDPLAPHALAVARRADEAEIAEPTARLFNRAWRSVRQRRRTMPRPSRSIAARSRSTRQSYGPDHPNVAIRLNNLAQLLQDTNRLAEAEPLMRRALAIDETSYGPDHPNVAIDLNNLASLLQATNRLAEAEPLMRRALAIDETELRPGSSQGGDPPQQSRGPASRPRTASPRPSRSMRRALAIDEKSYGPDHPNVATRLNNLARLLQATNRLAEAEPLMRRALAIDEKSYGPDHPDVATDLNNLAQLLQGHEPPRRGRAADAPRARDRRDGATVRIIPMWRADLNNLARLLQATNRLAEAEPLMRRALAIDEKSFGPDHPNTAIVRNNLAELEAALGKNG